MRYNFLDHYWPYCKFSCNLLVLYHHCTFNSPMCFKSQDFFSTHIMALVYKFCTTLHTYIFKVSENFLFNFRIMYIFSDILQNCFVACTVVWTDNYLCKMIVYMHSLFLVLCDRSCWQKPLLFMRASFSFLAVFVFQKVLLVCSVRLSKSTS